ncbi:hypothetical protein WMY93_028425 [Mugilogobius chulae]|uniref:Uncharacterized protein n=1 Tax=Mugilogobius chulae TaxID=88201 RepID=A0AAW0N020_9GOBI
MVNDLVTLCQATEGYDCVKQAAAELKSAPAKLNLKTVEGEVHGVLVHLGKQKQQDERLKGPMSLKYALTHTYTSLSTGPLLQPLRCRTFTGRGRTGGNKSLSYHDNQHNTRFSRSGVK